MAAEDRSGGHGFQPCRKVPSLFLGGRIRKPNPPAHRIRSVRAPAWLKAMPSQYKIIRGFGLS
jgi:hypothetical protein